MQMKEILNKKLESLKYFLFQSCFKLADRLGDHLNLDDSTFRSCIETYIKRHLYRGYVIESPDVSRLGELSIDEALYSDDYTLRHDIANKLIVDYSMNLSEVSYLQLSRCASIMLEGFPFTPDHLQRLTGIWTKQREGKINIETATSGAFSEEEAAIFNELNKN